MGALNDLIKDAATCQKQDGRYGYIAPYYAQAKDTCWTYVKRFAGAIPGVMFNEGELRADFPSGARLRLYGADNYDRMRGGYFDGAVGDEYADWDPRAWPEVVRPMLADRRGRMTFIGTPKGRNDFHALYERALANPEKWFVLKLRASETGVIAADELAAARMEMTANQYEQEFEVSFDAAILGAYFAESIADAERAGRITDVAIEPSLPVHTAWDLGMNNTMVIWCWQMVGKEVRVVDLVHGAGHQIEAYVRALNAKGYQWGTDWVPHDAKVRELIAGRTRVETLKSLGRNPRLVPDHKVQDGINSAIVSFPRVLFDKSRCAFGIEALRQYRADFDAKAKRVKDHPHHDWTSDFADAFRYLTMAWRELVPVTTATKTSGPRDPLAIPMSASNAERLGVVAAAKPVTTEEVLKYLRKRQGSERTIR